MPGVLPGIRVPDPSGALVNPVRFSGTPVVAARVPPRQRERRLEVLRDLPADDVATVLAGNTSS
ncbi:hypothetical protein ACE7GA_22575 [Roseomonas sp. CCTCC AB2023176]|uniref:hypothetical protein n=1 Tax=Roseomonas sp. CCTCC AB2023176 TaxID=3342640 RepID=UPI0035E31E3A